MLRHRFGCSTFYLPAVLGLLFSNPTARANPTGAQVVNGAVSMETIGNTLKITPPGPKWSTGRSAWRRSATH